MLKSPSKFIASAAFMASLGACDLDAYTTTVRVDHYREPCEIIGPDFCLRVLDPGELSASVSKISGFDYEPGYVYELDLLVSGDTDPGERSTSESRYQLLSVLGREPVDPQTVFTMELSSAFIQRIDVDRFELVTDISVKCVDASICDAVARAMVADEWIEIDFRHAESPGAFIAVATSSR